MKHILAKANLEVLAQFAWSNVLLALDFDGTLAPIVTNRDAAVMRWETQELLRRVARAYPTAVVSGRSRGDVLARLGDAPLASVVGNHGMEQPTDGAHRLARHEARMRGALAELEVAVRGLAGVEIEDKRFSLALHYRKSRTKRAHLAAIERAIAAVSGPPLRLIHGKLVANVLPFDAATKGDAVLALQRELRLDTIIYVGDDATDEDVFALRHPGTLLSIRVGASSQSAAEFSLRSQGEIDPFLSQLLRLHRR